MHPLIFSRIYHYVIERWLSTQLSQLGLTSFPCSQAGLAYILAQLCSLALTEVPKVDTVMKSMNRVDVVDRRR